MTPAVEVRGEEGLRQLLITAPARMKRDIVLALKIATRDIRALAMRSHNFRTRTGALEKSVTQEVDEAKLEGKVYLDPKVRYAKFVHDGIKRPYTIVPKAPRKALHFVIGRENIFAKKVTIPARAGDPFLFRAFEARKDETIALLTKAATQGITGGK